LSIVFAIGALTAFCSAQAADSSPSQEITITGTAVRTIPYDVSTRRPAKEISVTARVPVNLDVLTLNSGVALLKDNIRDAARTVCTSADPGADPSSDATYDCINTAVIDAQPQVDALVARARAQELKG
jgi:UrcA family protein